MLTSFSDVLVRIFFTSPDQHLNVTIQLSKTADNSTTISMPSLSKVKKSLVAQAKGSASAVKTSSTDEDLQPDLPVSSTAAAAAAAVAAAAHEGMMVIATVVDATSPATHEEKKPSANKRKKTPPSSTSNGVDGPTADAAVAAVGPPNKKRTSSYMQEPVMKPSYAPKPIISHTNIPDEYHKLCKRVSLGDGSTSSSWVYPPARLMPNPPLNPNSNGGGGTDEGNKFRSHLIERIAASARNMEFMTPHQAYGILGGISGGDNLMQGYSHATNNTDNTVKDAILAVPYSRLRLERTTREEEKVVKKKESDETDATTLPSEKEQEQKQGNNKKATKRKQEPKCPAADKEAIESCNKDNGDVPGLKYDYFENEKGYVVNLSRFDVLSGRGTGSYDNPGNHTFRQLCQKRKREYLSLNNRDISNKNLIAKEIIEEVHSIGGRFLRIVRKEERGKDVITLFDTLFDYVDEDTVLEKTKQALRQNRTKFVAAIKALENPATTAEPPVPASSNPTLPAASVPVASIPVVAKAQTGSAGGATLNQTLLQRTTPTPEELEALEALLQWKDSHESLQKQMEENAYVEQRLREQASQKLAEVNNRRALFTQKFGLLRGRRNREGGRADSVPSGEEETLSQKLEVAWARMNEEERAASADISESGENMNKEEEEKEE